MDLISMNKTINRNVLFTKSIPYHVEKHVQFYYEMDIWEIGIDNKS